MFSLNQILDYIYNHLVIFLGAGALLYFAYNYFVLRKTQLHIVDRSEIERIKFIERMKPNKSQPLYLYRGNDMLGLITHKREFILNEKPPKKEYKKENAKEDKLLIKEQLKEYHIVQLLVKSCIFWKIPNPFSKIQPFQLNNDPEIITKTSLNWYLPKWVSIDKEFGIYYDETIIDAHRRIIKNDNIIRTDLNNLASIYFAKSQEQATFDPINAKNMAFKEKELQIELAKKKGMQESL